MLYKEGISNRQTNKHPYPINIYRYFYVYYVIGEFMETLYLVWQTRLKFNGFLKYRGVGIIRFGTFYWLQKYIANSSCIRKNRGILDVTNENEVGELVKLFMRNTDETLKLSCKR